MAHIEYGDCHLRALQRCVRAAVLLKRMEAGQSASNDNIHVSDLSDSSKAARSNQQHERCH
eukprot:11543463-Karenia_brevis.AAC.1